MQSQPSHAGVPRGSQRELSISWEQSRTHYKAPALAVSHGKLESRMSLFVPTDSIKLLFSRASGSQLFWCLEVPERQQAQWTHARGTDRVASGVIGWPSISIRTQEAPNLLTSSHKVLLLHLDQPWGLTVMAGITSLTHLSLRHLPGTLVVLGQFV